MNIKKLLLIIMLGMITGGACHAQTFSIDTISDTVFKRMQGKSYGAGCTIRRSELRYLRLSYFDANGTRKTGEIVCNKKIANDLKEIFQELYRQRYPIQRMQLVDDFDADDELSMRANNTSCFNYRTVAGTNNISKHAQGLAIDINPLYNPCVKKRKDGSTLIQPETGQKYADRQKQWPYKIEKNDLCYKLFIKHGFRWGGAWRTLKDYQHFER